MTDVALHGAKMTQDAPSREEVLKVSGLKTYFRTRRGVVKAVDGASFTVAKGETLGVVGESGSGKSITSLSILGLLPQPVGRIEEGRIEFCGEDLVTKSAAEMRRIRGKRISMILQDPMTSLNPVLTIGDQLTEPLRQHRKLTSKAAWSKAAELLSKVHIPSPGRRLHQYPHEMSGGMRQRVVSAIGLSCEPELLIADEPTTALDVTIQAQVLELLRDLQNELQFAMIFITHDLDEALRIGDRIAILKDGKLVQTGAPVEILLNPADDYVEAFVKDVNRARAVPVKTIMQHAVPVIHATSLSDALAQLPSQGYAFYEIQSKFQGIITRKKLQEALKLRPDGAITTAEITKIPSVMPDMLLQEAISDALISRYSLPVLDEQGHCIGELSQENLAETLEYIS